MAGITLAEAETQLAALLDAEAKVLEAQAYSISGRSKTNADLLAIGERIEYYERIIARLSRGGIRITGGTPV